jgi:hypothetical protein
LQSSPPASDDTSLSTFHHEATRNRLLTIGRKLRSCGDPDESPHPLVNRAAARCMHPKLRAPDSFTHDSVCAARRSKRQEPTSRWEQQPNIRRHRWNMIRPAKIIGEMARWFLFIDPTKRSRWVWSLTALTSGKFSGVRPTRLLLREHRSIEYCTRDIGTERTRTDEAASPRRVFSSRDSHR